MEQPKDTLQTKYGLQIATYLYENPDSKAKKMSEDMAIPEATIFRNMKNMKEADVVKQDVNSYRLTNRASNFIEKLMDKAGYEPETYLEITNEYNHFAKRLSRITDQLQEVMEDE